MCLKHLISTSTWIPAITTTEVEEPIDYIPVVYPRFPGSYAVTDPLLVTNHSRPFRSSGQRRPAFPGLLGQRRLWSRWSGIMDWALVQKHPHGLDVGFRDLWPCTAGRFGCWDTRMVCSQITRDGLSALLKDGITIQLDACSSLQLTV